MKQTPDIEQLDDPLLYEKVLTLPYDDIAPFVLGEVTRPSGPMLRIWITLAATLFLSVWFWPGVIYFPENPRVVAGLTTGLILIPLGLVPVHEGLHLIPFVMAGARDIRFGADLRQGIIYVTAHRFLAGRRLFSIVAFTPFILVTLTFLTMILFTTPWWKWVLSMTLFVHTTMCAGDAALIGFMSRFGERKVFTWDDADKKEAYVYASAEPGKSHDDRNTVR